MAALAAAALLALIVLPPLLTGSVAGGEAQAAEQPEAKPPALPPLVIDRGAPLLLDDPSAKPTEDTSYLNINQACFVCHDNYKTESMVVLHAKDSVGCMDCHGPSLAHRNDEDNITPPDIMFPSEKIEDSCVECHDTHDVPAREVITRWQERCPEKTKPSELLCTDCHGEHRLKSRVVRWDKSTGKLIGK